MKGWDWRYHLQRGCCDYFAVYKTKTDTFLKTRDGDNSLWKNSDVFHLGRTWFKQIAWIEKLELKNSTSLGSLLPEP